MVDWDAWHQKYEPPDSPLARRLAVVQRLIGQWLDRSAPRKVRIASVCAGDGRDILQLLADRPDDAARATVTLLESDPRLTERARDFCADKALSQVEVRTIDASTSDAYAGLAPVDLLILVGLFGNIADDEIHTMVDMLPALCAPGGLVIWSRRPKDELLDDIDGWFEVRSFVQVFSTTGQRVFHVMAHKFTGAPEELQPGRKLFTFVY